MLNALMLCFFLARKINLDNGSTDLLDIVILINLFYVIYIIF